MEMASERSDEPLITAVIPTYNRPQLLRRAVKSVLCQTYPQVRVCVCADVSGEDTMEVLKNLSQGDPRVHYQRHSSRLGIAGNYRFGMQQVETPYFSLLGDDDVLLPDFYQKAMEGFQKFPEAAFSALATIVVVPRDHIAILATQGWQEGLYLPPEGLRKMLEFFPPAWQGVVFRRELIDQLGVLDAEVGHALDIDYLYRVAAHFPIAISLQPGALYVSHPGSATVQGSLEGVWPGWMKMIQNLTDDKEIPLEVKKLAARTLTERLKSVLFTDSGWLAVLAGRCAEAQRSGEILTQQFREERKAALLRCLVRIQRTFAPFGRLALMTLAARRKLRKIWNADYRQQGMRYLAYAKYLDLT
jgi:hypothetical protein